jgi:hypothetical protein
MELSMVVYDTAGQGVNIHLDGWWGAATGDGRDTLVNLRQVVGSRSSDTVYVGPSAPQLFSLATHHGNDTLTIAGSVTTPTGGYGDDTYNIIEGAVWGEIQDRGGHDVYNVCNAAWGKDSIVSENMDMDGDYEVHFC